MKSLFLTITATILFTGCASKVTEYNKLSVPDQRHNRVISTTSDNIRGLYARDNKYNLSGFNQTSYEKYLDKSTSENAPEMKKLFYGLDQREFTPYKHTFIFCGFSESEKLAFCDDAACSGVESIVSTESPNFSDLKKDLPLKECK